jgi:hypothetical protein
MVPPRCPHSPAARPAPVVRRSWSSARVGPLARAACVAGRVVLGFAFASTGVSGCAHAPRFPALATLTHADVAARLGTAARARRAVEGTARAALPGIGGAVLNATLDLAAAAPARLSVAVRSFFEVPAQVFVADGDVVTLYDASSGAPVFRRGPAHERALGRVLGVPLAPDDAVAVLLGRAPVDADAALPARVRLVGVDEDAGTYTASVERAGRGALRVTARVDDDAIVAWEVWRGDGRPLLRARCSDFVDVGGVAFARRIAVEPVDGGPGVVLTMGQATWNPPSLPDTAFVLEPPPGTPIAPL